MSDDVAARLAAIGPYSLADDEELGWVATWDEVPELASDLGPFGLEFRIESMGRRPRPLEPDEEMFRLWDAWRGRHPEYVAQLRRAVESHMAVYGASGDPAAQVTSAEISVYRVDDDGEPEVKVSATLGLECDGEHGVFCYMDPESGELDFQ